MYNTQTTDEFLTDKNSVENLNSGERIENEIF